MLKASCNEFFDFINTQEINEQLDLLLLDLNITEQTPLKVKHCLTEQKRVVKLLCQQLTYQASLKDQIKTIITLVALCQVQEALCPQKRIYDRTQGIKVKDTTLELKLILMICINIQCLFCFKQFTCPCKAYKHVKKLHLKYYALDNLIPCSYLVYKINKVVLSGYIHFKNYAATTYNIYLSEKYK